MRSDINTSILLSPAKDGLDDIVRKWAAKLLLKKKKM